MYIYESFEDLEERPPGFPLIIQKPSASQMGYKQLTMLVVNGSKMKIVAS